MLDRLIVALRGLLTRHRAGRELDEELRFHLEMETRAHVAAGVDPAEARRFALRDLGGVAQTREAVGDVRTLWIDSAWHDIRHTVRSGLRTPALTAATILTLALGVGATSAVYAVVNGVLVRPLPFPDSHQLVWLAKAGDESSVESLSWLQLNQIGEQCAALEGVGGYGYGGEFSEPGTDREAMGMAISPSLLRVLGAQMVLGRSLLPSDADPASPAAMVITERLWKRWYGGGANVLGQPVAARLRSDHPGDSLAVIVGVLGDGFDFPYPKSSRDVDVWIAANPAHV
jgi:hypothetical protein